MENRIPEYSNYPIPYLDIKNYQLDRLLIVGFEGKFLQRHCCIPIDLQGNILTVAVAKPSLAIIEKLVEESDKVIRIFYSQEEDIKNCLIKGEQNVEEIPVNSWIN
jgi:hypothetical protein